MITRRTTLLAIAGMALAGPAFALSTSQASRLVGNLVNEIKSVINSGGSTSSKVRKFERIFAKYADVAIISRSALGPAARSASRSELSSFADAFQGYMSRKYGKRFNDFRGGDIVVKSTRDRGKFVEVSANVELPGRAPIAVIFRVSDRSGKDLFFDIIIEGISLLSTERAEMGAMLDRRGGSISKLTRDLAKAG